LNPVAPEHDASLTATPSVDLVAHVAEELAQLEAAGARGFDAPLCDCVRALLVRADDMPGPAGARVMLRAAAYCNDLATGFLRDSQRAKTLVKQVSAKCGPQPDLERCIARGEVHEAMRRARRVRGRPAQAWSEPPPAQELARLPGAATTAPKRPKRAAQSLAYEDSVAEMVASLALARAVDVVPKDAGPYNPMRIASDLLDGLRAVSPFFLTVQLNRLEELGSLLSLPDLPEKPAPEPVPPPKKKLPSRTKKT
jgi:hypothetical protein